jgi:hypothetical protein
MYWLFDWSTREVVRNIFVGFMGLPLHFLFDLLLYTLLPLWWYI